MIFEVELRRRPSDQASSQGKLPVNTIVVLVGKSRGDYQLIEVELEDGTMLEGWVNENALQPNDPGLPPAPEPELRPENFKGRVVVPQDEGLLLRRKQSFFFGAQLGGNYGIITPPEPNNLTYSGIGLLGGAFAGFYASDNFPVRLEINYSQITGGSPDDPALLVFGFLEIAAVGSYRLGALEVFGGAQYNLGISINELPTVNFLPSEPVSTPADVSSPAVQVGAGYHFKVGKDLDVSARVRYLIHFKSDRKSVV